MARSGLPSWLLPLLLQNARIEHDRALQRAILNLLADHTDLFKEFSDNPSFKKWLGDAIFTETYQQG